MNDEKQFVTMFDFDTIWHAEVKFNHIITPNKL